MCIEKLYFEALIMVDLSCCLLLDVFDFFSFVGCRVDDNID